MCEGICVIAPLSPAVLIAWPPAAALRFCRKIVGLKDEFYNRYIIRQDLFRPIVKAFLANGSRYNLLNSAIIELFQFIKTVSVLCVSVCVCPACVLCSVLRTVFSLCSFLRA